MSSGSNKQHLQKLAESMYDLTVSHSIKLDVQWIPRKQNTIADTLSKAYDFKDWETTNALFKYLNKVWGPKSSLIGSTRFKSKVICIKLDFS